MTIKLKKDTTEEALSAIQEQLNVLVEQQKILVEQQHKRREFFDEMNPILKAVMDTATTYAGEAETRGYFSFAREALKIVDRVITSYSEEDVRHLGDNIVRILDTVKNVTQPDILAIANDATRAIHEADQLEPTKGILGMLKATRDQDVRRGVAIMFEVLRHLGRGSEKLATGAASAAPRLQPRAQQPAPAAAPTAAAPPPPPPAAKRTAAPPPPAGQPFVFHGVNFTAEGFIADPQTWTPALAEAVATELGVPLTDERWKIITFARASFNAEGAAPNVRKITRGADIATRDLYKLFPQAPGITIARIAGTSKPAGCI